MKDIPGPELNSKENKGEKKEKKTEKRHCLNIKVS